MSSYTRAMFLDEEGSWGGCLAGQSSSSCNN